MGFVMKAAIIIPARYASSRFPGKPLAMIAGQSLVERVYRRAAQCRAADAVYVATDDPRIFEHVASFDGNVVHTGEATTGTDRVAMALDEIERLDDVRFDQIINVQGDEPLVEIDSLERMIRTFSQKRWTSSPWHVRWHPRRMSKSGRRESGDGRERERTLFLPFSHPTPSAGGPQACGAVWVSGFGFTEVCCAGAVAAGAARASRAVASPRERLYNPGPGNHGTSPGSGPPRGCRQRRG